MLPAISLSCLLRDDMHLHRIDTKVPVKMRGFTTVELVTVLVIAGILAAMVMPRFFDVSAFRQRGFADEVRASLRLAQKTAIAQRRFVCVAFSGPLPSSVTLTVDPLTDPAAAGAVPNCTVTLLAGNIQSSDAAFVSTPANFYFNAAGKPDLSAMLTIDINGNPVYVEKETGYVH